MPDRIYLAPPNVGIEEQEAIQEVLKSGWVAPAGPVIGRFEEAIKLEFGYRNVLAVNSGTSALHLAIKLAGISRGDQVIVGSLTFSAAANVVLYEGGVPIFIDSENVTWNLSPGLLQDYLSRHDRGKIKALIVTHIYGRPALIEEITSICSEYGVIVIEDAAEAVGTVIHGRPAGSFGDFGVLSFNGNKIVTTGGGGALICSREEDYQRARYLAEQAKEPLPYYLHKELGYNYRLSGPLAAIGIAQLEKLDQFIGRKKEIRDLYEENLNKSLFEFPQRIDGENFWLSVALLKKGTEIKPKYIIDLLEKENIESRHTWNPLHNQPVFQGFEAVRNGVSDDLFERGVCLPSGTGLTRENQLRIIRILNQVIE